MVPRPFLAVTLAAIGFWASAPNAVADAQKPWWDDPCEVSVGRFSFGSGRLLAALWAVERLGDALPGDDGSGTALGGGTAPERLEPLSRRPPLDDRLAGSIRSVEPSGERPLALTFDLCQAGRQPAGYDADVVRVLRELDVRATFFAGGLWMRAHAERAMQLIADPRFEVGSHGWSHADEARAGVDLRREVHWAQSQYELLWERLYGRAARAGLPEEMDLVPRVPLTFRFPAGSCDKNDLEELAGWGLPAVQWDVVPGDPDPARSARDISRAILDRAHPGAIVVLHANGRGRHTAEALRLTLPALRRRDYRFVTVSDLLASGRARSSGSCYVLEPGDVGR